PREPSWVPARWSRPTPRPTRSSPACRRARSASGRAPREPRPPEPRRDPAARRRPAILGARPRPAVRDGASGRGGDAPAHGRLPAGRHEPALVRLSEPLLLDRVAVGRALP